MKWTMLLLVALLVGYLVYQDRQEAARARILQARMAELTDTVNRLAALMEQLLQERDMADVEIVKGDPNIGRPIQSTWTSGGQTIALKVYRTSTGESQEDWSARTAEELAAALEAYPPDVT